MFRIGAGIHLVVGIQYAENHSVKPRHREELTMRALVFHFRSQNGLLVFLNQLSNAAEIERTVFMAFAAGLVMYVVLMVGYVVARRILKATPPQNQAAEVASGSGTAETSANELSTQPG